jgi:signal transduction histidine kinase
MTRHQSFFFSRAAAASCLLVLLACQVAVAAESKRVMLLHSFGREFGPWNEYAKAIRTELGRQSPWPLDIVDHSPITARFSDEDAEIAYVEYLRNLYSRHPLDLIISLGAPAARFVQRRRQQLFPATAMLLTAVEQRHVGYSSLTDKDTAVAVFHDYAAVFENILRLLPDTKIVALVNGKSLLEQFWEGEIGRAAKAFENRFTFKSYSELSFEDILKDAAALPPRSAILWELMSVDAAGIVHEGDAALKRLHSVANAPIFSYQGAFFGPEIVGGPMHSVIDGSRRTVGVAIRILGGEKAGNIRIPASGFAKPKYNWREMQRWSISESRLPPGSEIVFRDPTLWSQYRREILAVLAAFLLQTALIFWLIYEHRRRHVAEVQSRQSMAELTLMNRKAAAGELSASIAHEISQPLAAIAAHASAALRWLRAPNLQEAKAALDHIVSDSHRAGDIITSIRSMFSKAEGQKLPVDINEVIRSALAIVRVEMQKNKVWLETQLDERLPNVQGDKVQLQQVVLNLIINAVEAMHSVKSRVLVIKSRLNKPNTVQVSIEDNGTGIDQSNLDRVFKPLFTTKDQGMGMGLSICHSIIERHNGRIWVSPGNNRGSIFHFELPVKSERSTSTAIGHLASSRVGEPSR